MKRTLVVLAAGVGSRYGGLKQLVPVGPGGEALLEYSVYDAVRAGFSDVVVVVRPETESAFRRRFDAGMARRVPLTYVYQTPDDLPGGFHRPPERTKPWGTGHAVLVAAAAVTGPFAVVNADDFYGADSFAVLGDFLSREHGASSPNVAIVGFEVERTLSDAGPVSRALCRLGDDGLVRDIAEIKEVWKRDGRIVYRDTEGVRQTLDAQELVSMNMWGFAPELLAEMRRRFGSFLERSGDSDHAEFLLPDVVRSLVDARQARVEVLHGSGPWCGLTFREDDGRTASVISSLVARGQYPKELWSESGAVERKRSNTIGSWF